MRLVYPNGETVQQGDTVTARDGTTLTVASIQEPHKPSSTGRVYVSWEHEGETRTQGYFPSVFGLEWVDREDR